MFPAFSSSRIVPKLSENTFETVSNAFPSHFVAFLIAPKWSAAATAAAAMPPISKPAGDKTTPTMVPRAVIAIPIPIIATPRTEIAVPRPTTAAAAAATPTTIPRFFRTNSTTLTAISAKFVATSARAGASAAPTCCFNPFQTDETRFIASVYSAAAAASSPLMLRPRSLASCLKSLIPCVPFASIGNISRPARPNSF